MEIPPILVLNSIGKNFYVFDTLKMWDPIIAGTWRRILFFAEAAKQDSCDPKINLKLILLFLFFHPIL